MPTPFTYSSIGVSGYSGYSGYSGQVGASAASGYSGISGYSGTSGYSGVSGYSGAFAGTGTSGYIPRFTGASSLGNSLIQDNGSTVTVNASTLVQGVLSTLSTNGVNVFESAGISSVGLQFRTNSTNRFKIETPSASNDLAFYYGGTTEVGRFSSTGLAITGVLSATNGLGLSNGNSLSFGGAGSDTYISGSAATDYIEFVTGAAQRALLNNAGLAVTGTLSATGTVTFRDAGNTYSLNVGGVGGTQIVAFGNTAGVPRIQAWTAGFGAATQLDINPVGGLTTIGAGLAVTGALSATGTITSTNGTIQAYGYTADNNKSAIFLRSDLTSYIYNNGSTVYHRVNGVDSLALTNSGATVYGTFAATGFGVNATPTGQGTGATYARWLNTSGDFYIGCESSTAGGFFTGSSAYASVFYSSNPIQAIINGVKRAEVSSTGLAVTGALSASGNLTLSAANPSLIGGTNAGSVSVQNPDAASYITIYGSAHATKANKIEVVAGSTLAGSFSSTGLAVTGALSASTYIQATGGGNDVSKLYASGTLSTLQLGSPTEAVGGLKYERSTGGLAIFNGTQASQTDIAVFSSGGLGVTGNGSFTSSSTNSAEIGIVNTSTGGRNYALVSWGSTAGGGALTGKFSIFDNTAGAHRLVIDTSGNLLVGLTTSISSRIASQAIDSAGNYFAFNGINSSGTGLFYVRSDGYISTGVAAASPYNATTAGAANCHIYTDGGLYRSTSSIKYKRDITDYTRGLADVLKLRPVFYKGKSKNDGENQFAGLIAEDVAEAGLDEFVVKAADGTPDALAYSNMVALTVKSIQELNANLVAELQSIRQRLAALESK